MSYAERTKRPPRTLTRPEVKAILRETGRDVDGFRDHIIISTALGLGLRESEIVALNIPDVTADGLRPKRIIQLKVFKRAALDADPADHRVHVPDSLFYKLQKYLRTIGAATRLEESPRGKLELFTSREGNRLSTRQVRTMFRRWQQRAGFDQLYPFHSLRHTAVTNVRRKTGDIRAAQRFARHANIGTTVRYDHVSDDELAAAVKDLDC